MFRNMNPLIFWIRLGLFFSWFFAAPSGGLAAPSQGILMGLRGTLAPSLHEKEPPEERLNRIQFVCAKLSHQPAAQYPSEAEDARTEQQDAAGLRGRPFAYNTGDGERFRRNRAQGVLTGRRRS